MLRGLIRELLVHKGYHVIEAANGTDAIKLCDEGVTPHALLTDVSMPGLTGEELAATLKEKQPGLKVVFMSGYAGTSTKAIQKSLISDDVTFLQKPFRMSVLLDRLNEIVGSVNEETKKTRP